MNEPVPGFFFVGQNYGAASFLTPINQPFPQDIAFLYTFTLDGAPVSTYNSTLPRFGDVSSQPPNYIWNPTIVFIWIPDPGFHTLEIDVLQGPILFDQFQYFTTNSTAGEGVGGGSSVVGGESEFEPESGGANLILLYNFNQLMHGKLFIRAKSRTFCE